MTKSYQYFVEGECEEKIIKEGKKPPYFLFRPGKIDVLNVVTEKLTPARVLAIKRNTEIILVYDVDKGNCEILKENIKMLNKYGFTKIYHIQSVSNFEDEIVRSTNINSIDDFFGTSGVDNFKKKFIAHKDIVSKLKMVDFDVNKIWATKCKNNFSEFSKIEDCTFIKKF